MTRANPRSRMWRDYEAAAQRLIRAIPDPSPPITPHHCRAVVEALRGMGPWAWQEMDQRCGYRDLGSWFAMVRATRDSLVYGPPLIAAINEPARKAVPA